MLNFVWTMAGFGPLFPGHITGFFMPALLYLSITAIGPAILSDGAGGQPGDGNTALFSSTFPWNSSTRENWLIGERVPYLGDCTNEDQS